MDQRTRIDQRDGKGEEERDKEMKLPDYTTRAHCKILIVPTKRVKEKEVKREMRVA
jgi:hypothetical protein